MVTLHHGDCLDVLKTLPDNSIDSIVTDPPYGLSFMGRKWDYDVPSIEVWQECLRVLKPGGYLLAFAGTRTQHRMAVRIEDAGFEIRDMIAWVYGSGFPKSLDVSKAIDKNNGEIGRKFKFTRWMCTTGVTAKQINQVTNTQMGNHYLTHPTQPAIPTPELWQVIRPLCGDVPEWVDDLVARIAAEREVVGHAIGVDTTKQSIARATSAQGLEKSTKREYAITAPATEAARQWQGWGTALKPALEPITVARKPLIGTVAENVLQWGVGGLNIDGCRVGRDADDVSGWSASGSKASENRAMSGANYAREAKPDAAGRWPANLIHDGSDEVVALFPMTGGGAYKKSGGRNLDGPSRAFGAFDQSVKNAPDNYGDSGSAARFFFRAKASKRDRDEGLDGFPTTVQQSVAHGQRQYGTLPYTGEQREIKPRPRANNHPTVKPTDLMRYLCRLVTPPSGVVLDPFMGSGSTGKAAVAEGFRFIGIEREAEYVEIARARIGQPTEALAPIQQEIATMKADIQLQFNALDVRQTKLERASKATKETPKS